MSRLRDMARAVLAGMPVREPKSGYYVNRNLDDNAKHFGGNKVSGSFHRQEPVVMAMILGYFVGFCGFGIAALLVQILLWLGVIQ